MGISRSSTVVIAYLIATTSMTPREALASVQPKRSPRLCRQGCGEELCPLRSERSDLVAIAYFQYSPEVREYWKFEGRLF